MEAHDTAAFKKHIRVYIGVFVALLVATILTVAVSYVHFGSPDSHAGNVAVALIIAVLKAGLVAGFFMHLVAEKRPIYTLLAFTGVFFLGLMILTVYAHFDTPGEIHHYLPPGQAHLSATHEP